MPVRSLKSFFPTADKLLTAELSRLGEVLLVHLKSYENEPGNSVYQRGQICQSNFRGILEQRAGYGSLRQELEYGEKQPEVIRVLMEAWDWLQREGILIRDSTQPAPWFSISRKGDELLSKLGKFEYWETLGVDRVKHDLLNGGFRVVGGPPENQESAWEWVRMKEGQTMLPARKRAGSSNGSSFIAESRIDELRKLVSAVFDFQKLIRMCEELNSSYDNGNLYATAMLTRGVLDHVPPLFGYSTFAEVSNNYPGGGRSFKEAMQHLEGAARKIGDGHLHMPIRKSEILPTPQQVYCGPQMDLLLSEIVRIMK